MRARDPELNSKWGTICTPVEMLAPDDKPRKTHGSDFFCVHELLKSRKIKSYR